jgi:hypothetical protein
VAGAVKVVCNVEVIGIGVDWPQIACISYCRPTKSEMRFVQNIGRGLRQCAGKQDLLILDHSDTHLRLGFVTEIVHDKLHDGKEKAAAAPSVRLPKECKACAYLKPYGALICPNCGEKSDPVPKAREFSRAALEEYNGKKSRGRKETFTMEQKAIFFAELKGYCLRQDYKPGWAAQKYRARFDVWPDWRMTNVAPISPSAATLQWICSQQIAWARTKHREGVVRQTPQASTGGTNAPAGFVKGTLCTEEDLRDFTDDWGLRV